ncbi:MAG: hypothetical protein ACPGVO_14145 [Spirulinaceae cyanobacterium]
MKPGEKRQICALSFWEQEAIALPLLRQWRDLLAPIGLSQDLTIRTG